jgi:hypothetical protein
LRKSGRAKTAFTPTEGWAALAIREGESVPQIG